MGNQPVFTRRTLIKGTAATVAGAAFASGGYASTTTMTRRPWSWNIPGVEAFYQTPAGITKFAQPLRGVGPGGIPVALPDGTAATGATHYSLNIGQYQDQLHPALGPTTLRGYIPSVALGEGDYPARHLGGIIVAEKGEPVQLTFTNNLPTAHILPVDKTLMGATGADMDGPLNKVSVHLHGGFVPWISDGGPRASWGPGYADISWLGNTVLNPNAAANQGEYYYPNDQSARMMWYHDHAFGTTRLNAYSGLASAYILRDDFEGDLRNKGLPDFVENGGNEIPLVIQDKIFVGANIATLDPTWTGPATPGSLWYPHVYERALWGSRGALVWNPGRKSPTAPNPSCIPEMFGDTMLANGTVYPEATVEARRYRFRILNACQARFLNLQLYVDDGSPDGITLAPATLAPTNVPGPAFTVIGTEGGFLSQPVSVPSNVPFNPVTMTGSLITAPAERWDLLIDFTGLAGQKVILYNDAPAPFPMGAPVNDYFPGAPKNPTITTPGFGPNTRQIMRFNVVAATSADAALAITAADLTAGLDPFLVPPTTTPLPAPAGVPVRTVTLNEDFDPYGRLLQRLGTNVLPTPKSTTYARNYPDSATETPTAASTEVWQIVNLTADTHPIHFHLVNVQILSRQPFSVNKFTGTPLPAGPLRGPDATELGWKETVRAHPGEVTTVIMKFDLPTDLPFTVPVSPNTGGNEYVWHCHILEHEEHDMMRPLIVM